MKFIKRIATSVIACGVLAAALMIPGTIKASSISISTNTSSVYPGGSFTVYVSINGGGSGMFYFSGTNATVSTGSLYCDGSCYITATAGSTGQASVSVATGQAGTANEVTDLDGNVINYGSAVVVNIINSSGGNGGNSGGNSGGNATTPSNKTETEKEEEKPTKDATSILSSLSVNTGKLSPAFAPTTTSYEVNLPAGTKSIKVDAKAKVSTSTVQGTGEISLQTGTNVVEVRCIAEDETSTLYTIKVNVAEKPIAYVTYKNTKLGVLNEKTAVSNLFQETTIKIDGKEVIAWVNKKLNMTLLYMQNEKTNTKELYLYDTKKKEATSIYKPFAYHGKNLVMIDVPEKLQKREGMKFTMVKLGDYELPGWEFKDKVFKNYALLYVMDEKGKTLYYQYEKTEDNLQLYSQAAAITQGDYQAYVTKMEKQNTLYLMVLVGLCALSVVLLITTIVMGLRRRKQSAYKKVLVEAHTLSAEAKSLLHTDE